MTVIFDLILIIGISNISKVAGACSASGKSLLTVVTPAQCR